MALGFRNVWTNFVFHITCIFVAQTCFRARLFSISLFMAQKFFNMKTIAMICIYNIWCSSEMCEFEKVAGSEGEFVKIDIHCQAFNCCRIYDRLLILEPYRKHQSIKRLVNLATCYSCWIFAIPISMTNACLGGFNTKITRFCISCHENDQNDDKTTSAQFYGKFLKFVAFQELPDGFSGTYSQWL